MSQLLIRDAEVSDAAELAPLLETLGYPADVPALRERLIRLQATDPTGRVIVAHLGGALLGFATLHCTPALHRPTWVGRITGLAVMPEGRRAGVGRRLVEEAERYFGSLGLTRVEVTSGPAHERAHPFYRHLGYRDEGIRFAKSLL
jgi:GNAT superfamily N-acetyltransferase